jgi:hypothetical protein
MNPRAIQWYGTCQPMTNLVSFLLLGYEPRFSLPWLLDYAIPIGTSSS